MSTRKTKQRHKNAAAKVYELSGISKSSNDERL